MILHSNLKPLFAKPHSGTVFAIYMLFSKNKGVLVIKKSIQKLFISNVFFITLHIGFVSQAKEGTLLKEGYSVSAELPETSEKVEITIPRSSEEQLRRYSPAQLQELIINAYNNGDIPRDGGAKNWVPHLGKSIRSGFGYTLRHIPTEALTFYTAVGALAAIECSLLITNASPSACSHFLHELKDPISYISFFLFMGGNHSTTHFLNPMFRMQNNVKPSLFPIPRVAMGYIGMAAGALLSGIAVDLYSDPHLTYIRKNIFAKKDNWTTVDQARWDTAWGQAYNTWVSLEKAASYVPHITSMLLSIGASSLTTLGIQGVIRHSVSRPALQASAQGIQHSGRRFVLQYAGKTALKQTLLFGARANKVGLAITGIMQFLAWDKYLFGPYINQNWNLTRATGGMQRYENAITHLLTSGYPTSDDYELTFSDNYAALSHFFSDPIHTYTNTELREGAFRDYEKDFLPVLFDLSSPFTNTMGDIPDLTAVVDQQDGKDITKGEQLLEDIADLDEATQHYRNALAQPLQAIFSNWTEFWSPFNQLRQATYDFYKHLIETKGQLSFAHLTPSPIFSWQSKGMLDAWYFQSRNRLNQSIQISPNRLHLESQLLHLGLTPPAVAQLTQLSGLQLTGLINLLQSEDADRTLVEYFNLGLFDISNGVLRSQRLGFERLDYQVRIEAYYLGISPEILKQFEKDHTPYILEFISFLEAQPLTSHAVYVFAANQRWDWIEIQTEPYDNLRKRIKAEQTQSIEAIEIAHREEISKLETARAFIMAYSNEIHADSEVRYFNPLPFDPRWFKKKHYGIEYFSTTEKLLINAVCGRSREDLQSDIVNRGWYRLGTLTFESPRLFPEKPLFCDQIRHVHHAFVVEENGRAVEYHNVLDYVSRNLSISLTDFDNHFWGKNQTIKALEQTPDIEVEEWVDQALKSYREDQNQAFANLSAAFYDHRYRNIVESEQGEILSKPYAQGIYQFEMDVIDYNLRVLVSLLPKDMALLGPASIYIDAIKGLASSVSESNENEPSFEEAKEMTTGMEDRIMDYFTCKEDSQEQRAEYERACDPEFQQNEKAILLAVIGRLLRNVQEAIGHFITIKHSLQNESID